MDVLDKGLAQTEEKELNDQCSTVDRLSVGKSVRATLWDDIEGLLSDM